MKHIPPLLICLAIALTARAQTAADTETFKSVVVPFLQQNCVRCHGPEKQKARLYLNKFSGNMQADASEAKVWESVLEKLKKGEMPPEDEPRPQAAQQARVVAWIDSELAQAAAHDDPRIYPIDGNRLRHELLFPPTDSGASKNAGAPSSPARLWRSSPMIYSEKSVRVARDRPPASPFSLTGEDGFKDYAALYRVDESETELLIGNAASIARDMMDKPKKFSGESARFIAYIDAPKDADAAPARNAVQTAFNQILRRDPSDEEFTRYGKLLKESTVELGRTKGMETMISAVLLRPESVFRFELAKGPKDAHGRAMLGPRELAQALSFALTDEEPDAELLRKADDGKLMNREEVQSQVRRLLDDSSVYKPRILRFFQEYFGYADAANVFKDEATRKADELRGNYNAQALVEDTDNLVLSILKSDKNVLSELLTTNKAFVSSGKELEHWLKFKKKREDDAKKNGTEPAKHPFGKKNQLFQHYNLKPEEWADVQPLTLRPEQRSGVLTQPSWLIAHSTNFENHAIKRGKWVRENLLGGTIPNTPITVDAKLLEDPHKTLRERMATTRDSFCWKCHQQMDPLGFTFEMYDHYGRFRTEEVKKPVDASGALVGTGDAKLDGPLKDAVDLMKRLSASERVEQVFVRHAFRYWMGRNETIEDAPVLQAAHRAYREGGGSMKALIVSLLSSDSFLFRKPIK